MNLTDPARLIFDRRQHLRGGEQDRHVGIVPARVHHADRLALELADRLAGERQFAFLAHRQAVHVGAQRDDRSRPPPFSSATTPVLATLVCGSRPKLRSRSAMYFAVSTSRLRELGMLRGDSAATRSASGSTVGRQPIDLARERGSRNAAGRNPCGAGTERERQRLRAIRKEFPWDGQHTRWPCAFRGELSRHAPRPPARTPSSASRVADLDIRAACSATAWRAAIR